MHHILHERIDLFEFLSPPDIAQLLWAVFLDAWDFFVNDFDGKGNPPTLGLHYTVGLLLGGIILQKPSCPLIQLLYSPSRGGGAPWGDEPSGPTPLFEPTPRDQVNIQFLPAINAVVQGAFMAGRN